MIVDQIAGSDDTAHRPKRRENRGHHQRFQSLKVNRVHEVLMHKTKAAISPIWNRTKYSYDLNGNMTGIVSGISDYEGGLWDDQNRMLGYMREFETVERYLYDADGYRIVRYPETGDEPMIYIRSGGQLVSEFVQHSQEADPSLNKDFVYGAGQLLVERKSAETFPTLVSTWSFHTSAGYAFTIPEGDDGGPYTADIHTPSGALTQVTGLTLNSNGDFWIDDSEFSTTETNFVRVKSETGEGLYSAPVALVIDPTVDENSENQITAMSVSRHGNDVDLRWRYFQSNSNSTKLYYEPEGGGPTLLTSPPLMAGNKVYELQAQALSSSCVDFEGEQNLVTSSKVPLPSASGVQDLAQAPAPCSEPNPPPPGPSIYRFADRFHHRDHLGNLRVVTDAAGAIVSEHDFYPFGTEMATGVTGGSRMRFTGHERDEETELDYMKSRFCSAGMARFLTIDPVMGKEQQPSSWNRYAYVLNNPLLLVDPDGREGEVAGDIPSLLHSIRNTVPESDRSVIQINSISGTGSELVVTIDRDAISSHESSSGNFARLKTIVMDERTVRFDNSQPSATFEGQPIPFKPISPDSALNFYGITLVEGKDNITPEATDVLINPHLGAEDAADTVAWEMVRASRFLEGKDYESLTGDPNRPVNRDIRNALEETARNRGSE